MWSEELKDGRKRYVERYTDPYTGKRKRVYEEVQKFTPQARNKAAKILQEKINAILSEKTTSNITVQQLYNDFYNEWVLTVKPRTIRTYKSIDKRILSLFPKDCLAVNVDRRLLQKIVNQIFAMDFSNETLQKHYSRIKSIFKYGVRLNYLEVDECQYVNYLKKKLTPEEVRKNELNFLNRNEAIYFITYFKGKKRTNHYYRITAILYLTGLRIGELLALREEDINWDEKTISVNATYDYRDKSRGETKTLHSYRIIQVSDFVLKLLRETIEDNYRRFGREILNKNKERYIFITRTGNPQTSPSIYDMLVRTGYKLGFDRNITPHTLRHSHISLLAELGVPLKQIMQRVGHADAKITMKIYTHVTYNMKLSLSEKLEDIKF